MTWLVWRQHRKQLLFGAAALLVLGVFFLATGLPMHDRFEREGLPDCLPQAVKETVVIDATASSGVAGPAAAENAPAPDTSEPDDATFANGRCVASARAFFNDYQNVIFAGLLLLILPMLVGMFWGAPLVAREIEHGTHRLVWTQGVSRLRWAVTKIGLVSTATLVLTAVFAVMLSWWIAPVIQTSGQAFAEIFFDIQGIVVFGYVLFALALGVFAGAVTGGLLPAMATTVVGFLGVRLLVMLAARSRYLPTESLRLPNGVAGAPPGFPTMRNDLHGDWILASRVIDNAEVLTVHPARDFWAFQAIETVIFVALAIGLLLAAVYWIRRRVA